MKVYALIHQIWDTTEIRGIYSTEANARQNIRHHERHNCTIEEFELDKGIATPITKHDTRKHFVI